jgi:hypothetical protein
MRTRVATALAIAVVCLVGLVSSVAASEPSCAAKFITSQVMSARPLGQSIVVPEIRNLTLGGPNLGEEVKVFFATADKGACPIG